MKILLSSICFFAGIINLIAQKVTGTIADSKKQPLSFASILVKGTSSGTSANKDGYYSLPLTSGTHTIICQSIGYKSEAKTITIGHADVQVNFVLKEQQYELGNVSVKNGANPADEIIRNAIKKRPLYEKELKKFTTQVYIKGQLQLRSYPRRFFGQKVDFEDGDTTQHKMVFLSETVANYSVDEPKRKVEVVSTKVSGQSEAFGLSSPQIISFYEQNIKLGENLNPRGFISPISDNAFNYYNYRFEGTFFDNGKMINRIKVIPKRSYEPLFNGYLNIMENEWRIYSVQLKLYKENQMQFVDTLSIEQLYVPLKNVWVIKQQTIYPAIKLLGFDAYGSFVQVYDKFNLDPVFPGKFFDNTILKIYDSANKKTFAYWDKIRPIPLEAEEVKDYKNKTILEQARKQPAYLDSIDRIRNKIKPTILVLGQTFTSERKRSSVYFEELLKIFSYNTVEGFTLNFKPVYEKRFSAAKRNALTVIPGVRYGFANKRFNPNLSLGYRFGEKYLTSFTVAGGRDVYQFNNQNPVRIFGNTLRTLDGEKNYLKIYEAGFGRIDILKELGAGFTLSSFFEYQDRLFLNNTTNHKWRDYGDRAFTPNITEPNHQASVVSLNIKWQPGAKYIELPERKINIGSPYPTFNLRLTKGISGFLGSDVDYTKWLASINDDINLNIAGSFSYRITSGGFLNRKSVFFPDFNHYNTNLGLGAAPYVNSFQLLPYYNYSNNEKLYSTAHIEYHLNGLLTNKIPLFKKLNWFLVTGSNFLYIQNYPTYTEVFVGLENIFKIGRLDYVRSFTNNNLGWKMTGFRYSVGIANL
jgi:hypothetical protein